MAIKRLQPISGGEHFLSASLLTTKLTIPPGRAHSLSRPRLIDRLNLALQNKLTLVSAPAGFGKTTLLSEWCRNGAFPAAWISLDPSDNDPTRFWGYMVAALDGLHPGMAEPVLAELQSPQPPPIESILTGVVNELSTSTTDLILVLDDYHVIHDQTIHRAMAFLLDHLPQRLHLIIASRADPPLPLARWRASGHLIEIVAAHLRFLTDEIRSLLNAAGLHLPADEIAALENRTEGWVAGLQLALLSLRERGESSAFIQAIVGSHRYIMDYLVEEVLHQQPEPVQNFLLHTSILDRLTGELCDAVTGGTQGQWMLEQLERSNLFIVPLDEGRHWYRYHHLFADLLRSRLNQSHREPISELHRRAAEWYERHAMSMEAMPHALEATDFERAARIVEQAGPEMMQHGKVRTLLGWLKALPGALIDARPNLGILYVWAHLLIGELEGMEARLAHVEQQLRCSTILSAAEIEHALGRIAALRAGVAETRGDAARAIVLCHEALDRLPSTEAAVRSSVAQTLGGAYTMQGDAAAASRAYVESWREAEAVGNIQTTLLAMRNLAQLQVMQGQLHRAAQTYEHGLSLGGSHPELRPAVALAYLGKGDLLREWNRLAEAAVHIQRAIELCQGWGHTGFLAVSYMNYARVLESEGKLEEARDAIQTAASLARTHDIAYPMIVTIGAYQARLWVEQGDVEAALGWAEQRGVHPEDHPAQVPAPIWREVEYIVLARALLARPAPARNETLAQALQLLSKLLASAEAGGRFGRAIEILVLRAIAYRSMNQRPQALDSLGRALRLAESEDYIRMFLDEGGRMTRLLQEAQASGKSPEYAAQLLEAAAAVEETPKDSRVAPGSGMGLETLIEPLTERELEVLRLITQGLSNSQIAQSLTVTVGTAKRHVNNIYGKLNVRSRTQAVARARQLHIL